MKACISKRAPRAPARALLAAATLASITLTAIPAVAQPPSFVGLTTATTGPGGNAPTSITLGVPAGAAGDLLVLIVGVKINPATATPAGWTSILSGPNTAPCDSDPSLGFRCQLNAWYRISDGSETSVTVSWATERQAAAAVLRYSGTDATNPIGAVGSQAGTSASPAAPSINTTQADSLVIRTVVSDVDTALNPLNTSSDTDDETAVNLFSSLPTISRFSLASTSPIGPGSSYTYDAVILGGSDSVFAAVGATGTAFWGIAAVDQWRAFSIEVLAPSAPSARVDADLAISKDDGEMVVAPGDTLIYTIVASNNGPGDVAGATVSDSFPATLTCSWTCAASAGASCTAGPLNGDINDSVDLDNGASATFTATCTVDGGAAGTITNSASITEPQGVKDTEPGNDRASDETAVQPPPVAQCMDVAVKADNRCLADADIDDGSFDPDGDPVTLSQDPPGPYGLGDTTVTLTVEDDKGLSDSCQATVTVEDKAAPVILCNAPATIAPPDPPISFTATATDDCRVESVVITARDCFAFTNKGKRIDKTQSCVVQFAGNTVSILDSGGVGDTITWSVTATDGGGNSITRTCTVRVVNPGLS